MGKQTGGRRSAAKSGDFVPDAGDLIWISFDPQSGREQAGRRPGLVISPRSYNLKAGLLLVCPITSQSKRYPFEVELPAGLPIHGVVLADHLRSADWRTRTSEFIASAPTELLDEVRAKLKPLLGY